MGKGTPGLKQVLILGAGKIDQQRNPELKMVKASASRGQPGRAALGSFDHYHNGNGFWVRVHTATTLGGSTQEG